MKPTPIEKDIYVAGASAQIETIEVFMSKLRVAGWKITFDWTVPVREVGSASPDDPNIRKSAALADLTGVLTARVLWLLQPDATSTSTGAWVELGSAITKRILAEKFAGRSCTCGGIGPVTVIASGSSKKCIFSDLADYRFQSHEDAFEFITKDLGRE
jgi:hypothetical protein